MANLLVGRVRIAPAQIFRDCALLVGRVRIAPAQIFRDCAREQHVLLQHHRDLVAQRLQLVVAHVDATHFERAGRDVIQARNELHAVTSYRRGMSCTSDVFAEPVPPTMPIVCPERMCRSMSSSTGRSECSE